MVCAKQKTRRRWSLVVLAIIVVGAVAIVAGLHFAARSVKDGLLDALGPNSDIADVKVGFTSVTISGIQVRAPKDWPTKNALTAERLVVVPRLKELISGRLEISSITIENGYIAAIRAKEGGGIKILPDMTEQANNEKGPREKRKATIQEVFLRSCTLEFHDHTLTGWKKLRIENVDGQVKDIRLPELGGRTMLDLKAAMKGPNHLGTATIKGWIEVASKNSEIQLQVRNVDLGLFEPYVVKVTKAGIDRGTFNLDLHVNVRDNVLQAPGTLTLAGLELKTGTSAFSGLSNLPRRAVLAALEDDHDRTTIHFELKGNLDNPSFSLTDSITRKAAAAMIKALGLSLEGLIRAVLILLNGFGGAFGGALQNS